MECLTSGQHSLPGPTAHPYRSLGQSSAPPQVFVTDENRSLKGCFTE